MARLLAYLTLGAVLLGAAAADAQTIPNLPAASGVNSTDLFACSQSGVTRACSATQLLASVLPLSGGTLTGPLYGPSITAPLQIGGTTASSTLTLESTSGAGTSDNICFKTGSQVTALCIDSAGYVLGPGLTTHLTNGGLLYSGMQYGGNPGAVGGGFALLQHSNDTSSAAMGFYKTRSTSVTGLTAIQNGDDVGEINYNGSDGTNYIKTAYIDAVVSGAVSTGVVPSFLEFATTNPSGVLQTNHEIDGLGNSYFSAAVCAFTGWTASLVNSCPAQGGYAFYGNGIVTAAAGQGFMFNAGYASGFKYITTGYADGILQTNGDLVFETAPSGTAGGALTLTEQFRVQQAGGVKISNLSSDASQTDNTLCIVSSGVVYKGSGTLGVCLGTSSERYKHGLKPLETGLDEIMQLHPKRGFLNPDKGDPTKPYYWITAEDGYKAIPELVGLDKLGRPNTFDLVGLVPVLVNGVQQLNHEVTELRAKEAQHAADLKAVHTELWRQDRRIAELESKLAKLESNHRHAAVRR